MLSVDEIGAAVADPSRVVGMHFFSPANVMKLLEVVRADATSDAAVALAMGVGARAGKVPVLCAKSCFGFIGNRMLEDYAKEAHFLVEEGCAPAEVDAALRREVGLGAGRP